MKQKYNIHVKKWLLGSTENIKRDSYFYNSMSGIIQALQSVIILIVLTRIVGLEGAGEFTIAYAVANMMLNIGKFGMRNFQASDVYEKYRFGQYLMSRIITTAFMVAISIVYTLIKAETIGYTINKTLVIIFMCMWKAVDSIEDVFQGQFQKNGRLDVAGKTYTLRQLTAIIVYIGCLLVTRDLLFSTIVTVFFSIVVATYLLIIVVGDMIPGMSGKDITLEEAIHRNLGLGNAIGPIRECINLFLSVFLSFYIISCTKYVIDRLMNSDAQAKFGFIAMPVFAVGLLCQFIFMPKYNQLAVMYAEQKFRQFSKIIGRQIIVIMGMTLLAIMVAATIGIPVLSALYATDLTELRTELCVLMVGSGLVAYSEFMLMILTLMRHQNLILIGYIVSTLLEVIFADSFVRTSGIRGAAVIFTMSVAVLSIYMLIIYFIETQKWKNSIIIHNKNCDKKGI